MISKEKAFEVYYKEIKFFIGKNEGKDELFQKFDYEKFIEEKRKQSQEIDVFIESMTELQVLLSKNIDSCIKKNNGYENSIKVLINNSLFLISHSILVEEDTSLFYLNYFKDKNDFNKKIKENNNKLSELKKITESNLSKIKESEYKNVKISKEEKLKMFSLYQHALSHFSHYYNQHIKGRLLFSSAAQYSIFLIEKIQREMKVKKGNTVSVKRNRLFDFLTKQYMSIIVKKTFK